MATQKSKIDQLKKAQTSVITPSTEPTTIRIEMPKSGTRADFKIALAQAVPGWGGLTSTQQGEMIDIAIVQAGKNQPVTVALTPTIGDGTSIAITGDCEALGLLKLQNMFSATTIDPVNARANELLQFLGSVGAYSDGQYNAALSFIESMAPRDQAEALLLVQMYVTHKAAIRALSMMGSAEWTPQTQTFGNLATKLLRTSQGQMETLARLRRGGEQVVRHVHVDNRGGQAVIAESIHNGGHRNERYDDQSRATEATDFSPAMLGQDPFGIEMPVTRGER